MKSPCSVQAAVFLSATGGRILLLSFSMGQVWLHAQDGSVPSGHMAARMANTGALNQLEGDGTGVMHDKCHDIDRGQLQAGQRLVGHGFRRFDAAKEVDQVVGRRVTVTPHLAAPRCRGTSGMTATSGRRICRP